MHSKQVTGIELENPRYKYIEGETSLDLTDLKVKADYSNAESEYVTDFVVNEAEFNPNLLDEEQNITVTYTHAGKSASASFPVKVYGIPLVSVDENGYNGEWTADDITFNLSSTHQLDGVTYYYKTDSNSEPIQIDGNSVTINSNTEETYYFKAVNSEGIESEYTAGYSVHRDDITPSFTLTPETETLTNKSYTVAISDLSIGNSGIQSITVNGNEISKSASSFTVNKNETYTVVITAGNGLSGTQTINIQNIDTEAPQIKSIDIANKSDGSFARFINKITFGLFFNQKVEITITAEDTGVAGLDTVEYRFLDENGNPTDGQWQKYNSLNKP
ncbi:MAG: hypothetical protein LUG21_07380, partial [Clostridiales bacterium]|nr:hypothetical protein [Clostridiales bacterium]